MRIQIHGGTASHGDPPLCQTCRFATIVKGPRIRDEIVECGRLSHHARISFRVTACSDYADRRVPSIREMEDLAWVLRSDPRRNQAGFVPARRLKPEDRHVLPGEWD
jgi:hypothetical protein